jgi:hypothetical protein
MNPLVNELFENSLVKLAFYAQPGVHFMAGMMHSHEPSMLPFSEDNAGLRQELRERDRDESVLLKMSQNAC